MVYTSRGSILINKSPCGFFGSSCGLGLGDPLSPYLFILAMEILSLKVEGLRLEGAIVSVSPVQPTPRHLLYADNILIFLKAYKRELRRLLDLLSTYQDSSGQCFNLQKNQLFLGKYSVTRASMVTRLLPIPQASLPSVFLGVRPLILQKFQTFSLQWNVGFLES